MTQGSPRWTGNQMVFTDWRKAYRYGIELAERSSPAGEVRVVPVLDDELRDTWFKLGRDNPWIKTADDPPFTENSFIGCYSVDELAERIRGTVWAVGAAFY